MKKIFNLLIILLVFGTTMLTAQQSRTSLTYGVGFPVGDLGDFVSKTSFRGIALDYRNMYSEKLGMGVSFGWNVFYDARDYDTYTKGTASLSGKQYRYSNNLPMLVSFDYYLNPGQKVNKYVGLGTGVMYTRRNTDMNLYTLEQEAWNFTLQPQIGLEFDNTYSSAFTIVLKYFYGFAAGDLEKAQSYLSLNFGWTFKS